MAVTHTLLARLSLQGVDGHIQPLPAVLSHLEGQGKRLVVWDVKGTHRSFGQLLLLGRAAHCVQLLERSLQLRCAVDGDALRDLQDSLALMAALCRQQPGLVEDLMSLTVRGRALVIQGFLTQGSSPCPYRGWQAILLTPT
jgi:hypothetical protein